MSSPRRRVGGAALAFALIAATAAAVGARASRPTPPQVHVGEVAVAATPTLVPGAPTTFVTLGADKVLRVTDTPGNAALLFIHQAQGHEREEPVDFDGVPQTPNYSELTPGTITITSKDQIQVSTTSYSGQPTCTYVFGSTKGMEDDPEVVHHVVCQVDALTLVPNGTLEPTLRRTDLITATKVDPGDQDDSVTVRADPLPPRELELIDTDAGWVTSEIQPRLVFLNDLQNWNVYGGLGNDWIDVNVTVQETAVVRSDPTGAVFDPDHYNGAWHLSAAHVFGGDGNDTLTGGRGADWVYGENGNDALVDLPLRVSGTSDHLYGGAGNDAVDGRDGPDYLDGGSGTDRINGGTGKDHIYANDGEADQVACGGQGDIVYYDAGKDTVFSC